jgi:transcriptional regulator with XRE-family HTH domain
MPSSDDGRLGVLLRAIRRRTNQRQADLAAGARVPRRDVQRIESGRAGEVRLDRVRRTFEAAGGRLSVGAWWRGAAADRLLDERHAALVERTLAVFRRRGWLAEVEVSFSEFGERGSIDILAGHRAAEAIAVAEVKASMGSLEELNRSLDVKVRLGPGIARARFGWTPRLVGRVLIVPEGQHDPAGDQRARRDHGLHLPSAGPGRPFVASDAERATPWDMVPVRCAECGHGFRLT